MRPDSILVQILAVLSRRTSAFRPTKDEPASFPDRLTALVHRKPADNADDLTPAVSDEPTTASAPGQKITDYLAQFAARERLELRSQLPLKALHQIRRLAQACVECDTLFEDLGILARALNLDRVLDGVLDRVRVRACDLDGVLDRVLVRVHVRVLDLDGALDRARGVVRSVLDRALFPDLDRVLDLDRALDRGRDLVRALDLDLDLDRDLDGVVDVARGRDLVRALDLDRGRDLDGILDLGIPLVELDVVLALDRVLDRVRSLILDLVHALVLALDRALIRARILALIRARILPVRGNDEARQRADDIVVVIDALLSEVNDFTVANLADIELCSMDLRGVQWSILTTRWPQGWEDPIREASIQLDPDRYPDLYEVRDDPRVPVHIVR